MALAGTSRARGCESRRCIGGSAVTARARGRRSRARAPGGEGFNKLIIYYKPDNNNYNVYIINRHNIIHFE